MKEQRATIKITTTMDRKEKLQLYVEDYNYKSVSSLVNIATDFYMNKNLYAGDMSSIFFTVNENISQLEQTNLNSGQKCLLNNIKEGMNKVYGYFQG